MNLNPPRHCATLYLFPSFRTNNNPLFVFLNISLIFFVFYSSLLFMSFHY